MFSQVALTEIIKTSGIHFREGAVSFIFTCPRCHKSNKLYIRKRDGRFTCFYCSAKDKFSGKAEWALSELCSMSIEDVRERLYGLHRDNERGMLELKFISVFDDNDDEFGYEEDIGYVDPNPDFVGFNNEAFANGRSYLLRRGLTDEIIKEYKILFHPAWQTVVFPIFVNGFLKGWQERAIDRDFKYTLKGFKKEHYFMFQDRLMGAPHAILCEGPVDALKCATIPGGGNVASMGKGVSLAQLDILRKSTKKLYVALDPDATTEIDKICRQMYDDVESIYIMQPPKGKKDLGECTFEECLDQFHKAEKYCGQVYFTLKGAYGR